MTPFEYQQKQKAQILGCYNNVDPLVKAEEAKPVVEDGEKKEPPAVVTEDEAKKKEKEQEEAKVID